MDNEQARAAKMREQNHLRVKRCREKQKLSAEGHSVKTTFNDRTNIQQSADNANTPNVAGKVGQQGYHSGSIVSQQGKSVFTTPNDKENCDEDFRRTHQQVGALEPHRADPEDDESWLHRNDNFFPIKDQTNTPIECLTQIDNEQARAQKTREQNRLRVKRCREKQKLNAEGQIVKTPFNDRANIQQSAVNTPNVGGKLGQQGYHSGNIISQQGRKRKKEQNAGERSATIYSKQRKLFEQLDDNQKAAIRERDRVYVACYCTHAMTKQIVIDQDDLETSPNDTPMPSIDDHVDDLEKPPNDTPMSVVNDPAIDSEEEFDEFEASTIPITDSIEDEVFYNARDVSYKSYRVDKSNKEKLHCIYRMSLLSSTDCSRVSQIGMPNTLESIYAYTIHGQVYHRLDQLVPGERGPRHIQLYFYDIDETIRHIIQRSPNLDEGLIRTVLQILDDNPYVHAFRSLGDVSNLDEYKIELNTDIGVDQRRYNAPTVLQVAAIWEEGTDTKRNFR